MEVWTLGKNFFLKLAVTNIGRDKKMYLPFAFASTAFVSIYFMVVTIMYSKGIADVPAGDSLQMLFGIGMVVMNILTVLFMLYINSFIIKRRKKEFGLYGILGLEKRHVGWVILLENLMISISSIILGIITGCIFGKLIFLLIFYSLKVSANSRFILPWQAFAYTGLLFSIIFVLTSLFNLLQVQLANPVDLLKGDHMGEKKVRFILLKTLIGLVLLGWAYYTALTVNHALTALTQFLQAVVAVIFASYLLFEAGSLFLLSFLKGRKKIFYKSGNFIAIAGLFHRMKQNAAGLASICILSTMVMVTVSTCTALYLGQEGMLKFRNPNDIEMTLSDKTTETQTSDLSSIISSAAGKYNVEIQDEYYYSYLSDTVILKDSEFSPVPLDDFEYMTLADYIQDICFITLEDYNKIMGTNDSLGEKEVLLLADKSFSKRYNQNNLAKDYQIKSIITDSRLTKGKNTKNDWAVYVVVNNRETAENILKTIDPGLTEITFEKKYVINGEGSDKDEKLFHHGVINESKKLDFVKQVSSIVENREMGYGIYGGLLFLGIFFTTLFLVATVLIIYFKQISEGYDDKERFIILQKVGMDDREVKRTINKQILIVFFLPLVGALMHVTAARHMIIKLLEVFYLYDVSLTTWCIVATCLVFAIVYTLVFRVTARNYYKIVKW